MHRLRKNREISIYIYVYTTYTCAGRCIHICMYKHCNYKHFRFNPQKGGIDVRVKFRNGTFLGKLFFLAARERGRGRDERTIL